MHLYSLTLQQAGAVTAAVFGNFSAPRQQEVVVAKGHILELLRPDETGKLHTVLSRDAFGIVRALLAFRLFGGDRDFLVVASDSGRISFLEFQVDRGDFVQVHLETFGKSGCRRLTPGQYLASDPKGRAVMIAGIEKQKLVYVMNRTPTEKLTISSPLEAHKSHAITYDVCGLDVAFDNPVFAALEVDYAEADADATGAAAADASKLLVYYELDLGLNNMTRKWSRATHRAANALIPVPGLEGGGPGGVLVCAENWLVYESPTQEPVHTPIPRRADLPDERGLLLTAHATHVQRPTKDKPTGSFFFLLQSELGDLYKATLVTAPGAAGGLVVVDVEVQYFDSIPPAVSLCITRTGLLFVAADFGNHFLYQFTQLGDSEGDSVCVAHAIMSLKEDAAAAGGAEVEVTCPTFSPRPLTNLAKLDETHSLAPITDMHVVMPSASATAAAAAGAAISGAAGVSAAAPQVLTLCGRGPRSTLRLLREGVAVSEIAQAPMPGNPMAIFTVRASHAPNEDGSPAADKFVILSFTNATLVMSIGETMEEVVAKDVGFTDAAPTLAVALLADDSMLQVHPLGMRHIKGTGAGRRIAEWRSPGKRAIVRACCNERQVALALSGGEVMYFEMGDQGSLMERERKVLGAEITALAIGPIPEGRLRAPHLTVADASNMVRVFSLDPAAPLSPVSAQALRAPAESLAVVSIRVHGAAPAPHLFIGLANGILTRVAMDAVTGLLTDPRSRFLGVRPVKLAPVAVGGGTGVLAMSTRPWLCYNHGGKYHCAPVSYDTLEAAAPFASGGLADGIVGVSGASMRVFALERLGETFNQKVLPLRYTPRRMAVHPHTSSIAVVIEADHNAYTAAQRESIATSAAAAAAGGDGAPGGDAMMDAAAAPPPPPPPAAAAPTGGAAAAASADDEDMDTGEGDAVVVAAAAAATTAAAAAAGIYAPGTIPPTSLTTPGEARGVADPQGDGVDVRRVGPPLPASPSSWGSAIRVVDLSLLAAAEDAAPPTLHHAATQHLIELGSDEAAMCVATATFHDRGSEAFVIVGTVVGLQYHPRSHRGGFLHTFRFMQGDVPVDAEGREVASATAPGAVGSRRVVKLQLVHRTPVEDIPTQITAAWGRILVGVGRTLRLYDLGARRLLRKSEARGFPGPITSIAVSLDRVFVGDALETVHVVKYKHAEGSLVVFADDVATRHTTALAVLDHDTVAGADKFGNVFVVRVPKDVSDNVDNPTGTRLLWDTGKLSGAPHKLQHVAQYYVGEAVTSLTRAAMAGGQECLLYSTILGSVGALLPFASKDDVDFFTHLELFMRGEPGLSPLGREHVAYRSSFVPVKDVVDGDLCEAFGGLPAARQKAIAGDLDRTPQDVWKKLEDTRNKIL